ncbi:MAG TPA: hypothetical protein VHP37_25620 [Burkholderiales bacterium]|nr:hypothetical protein [Burkholderiales bacterium]
MSEEQNARPPNEPASDQDTVRPPESAPARAGGLTHWLDVVNKVLQSLAIVGAAAWGYWTWDQASAPSLNTRLSMTGGVFLQWSREHSACYGTFSVTVENPSPRRINVHTARYELLRARTQRLAKGESVRVLGVGPVDAQLVKDGRFDRVLQGDFPPKAVSTESVNFLLAPSDGDEYWFQATLSDKDKSSLGHWFTMVGRCEPGKP